MRAAAPDTIGVDMEVPLFVVYPLPPTAQLIMSSPRATMSGLGLLQKVGPLPEKAESPTCFVWELLQEPTVITLRLMPGVVIDWYPGPLLPADTSTVTPSSQRASTLRTRWLPSS